MRKNIVAGNWKMNLNRTEGIALVEDVLAKLPSDNNTHVVFAPSFVYLHKVAKMCASTSKVVAAAQDCSANKKGAFTGEVSAIMIASCNAKYVVLGHSERRAIFHEMISNYLRNRSNLNCLFVLIDSRHKPQSIDQDFLQWLAECQIPFVMVFTKSDKLGKRALENNIETYKSEMIKNWEYLPKIFVSSAEKKKGLQEILDYIMSLNSNFSVK